MCTLNIKQLNWKFHSKCNTALIVPLHTYICICISQAFLHPHIIWMAPIHLAVTLYLIYLELGWSSFVIMAFILFQIPMQISLAKLFSRYRYSNDVYNYAVIIIMQ